jgi:hypothetical protein
MCKVICCIPADNVGNKLWIKDFREDSGKMFLKYRSTFNKMPFTEIETFIADGGKNLIITGDDGTVLFRFPINWITKLVSD